MADLSAHWRHHIIAGKYIDCDGEYRCGCVLDDISGANIFSEEFVDDNSAQLCFTDYDPYRGLGYYVADFPVDNINHDVYSLLCSYSNQRA